MKGIEKRELKIEYVDIDTIEPNPKNPRKITPEGISKIAQSIEQFDFINPIICWKKGNKIEIVAGHQRYRAAKTLGMEKVPVIIVNFQSDKEALAYGIADNRLNQESKWDVDILLNELPDITLEIDLENMGFTHEEINDLKARENPEDMHIEKEQIPFHIGKIKGKIPKSLYMVFISEWERISDVLQTDNIEQVFEAIIQNSSQTPTESLV